MDFWLHTIIHHKETPMQIQMQLQLQRQMQNMHNMQNMQNNNNNKTTTHNAAHSTQYSNDPKTMVMAIIMALVVLPQWLVCHKKTVYKLIITQ